MKVSRLLLCAAIAAALATTLVAQQPATGYHTVACLKVKPENAAEFQKFLADFSHKIAQGRVDNGEVTTWYLLRAVLPQGTSAECDYLFVAMFPGAPHLAGPEYLSAAIKKAGLSISPQDYVNRRNALSAIESVAIFQNQAFVGSAKKGDYFRVNYMKVPNVDDWVAYEKKVWKPLAEAFQQEGLLDGWSINAQVLPGGSDLPYQAVTVDVFPSFNAIFADDPKFAERFRKVHPDMELGTTFEQFAKLRTIESIKVFELEDVITAAR